MTDADHLRHSELAACRSFAGLDETIQEFKSRREIHMKQIAFILAVAVFCRGVPGSVLAQINANIGAGKPNLQKSKFPTGHGSERLDAHRLG
jgi:hypothetical protein